MVGRALATTVSPTPVNAAKDDEGALLKAHPRRQPLAR